MATAEFDGELWIGAPAWPGGSKITASRRHLWDGLDYTDFQIAGYLCHHQKFYGLKFHVPQSDPLADLGQSYLRSCLPGDGNPEAATPLEEIVRLRERLTEIDLVLNPVHYAKFAEAYFPIDAESAWRYATSRHLPLFVQPHQMAVETTTDLALVGLGESWEDAAEYLRASWELLERECEPERRFSGAPQSWTAVFHYQNCD